LIKGNCIEREREITISACVQSSLHNVGDRNGAWRGERRRREVLVAGGSRGMVCAREECGGEERETREGREKIGWREEALGLIDAMHVMASWSHGVSASVALHLTWPLTVYNMMLHIRVVTQKCYNYG
jgi:hypothetical protein